MVRGDLVARRLAGERPLAVAASATVLFALTMLAALAGFTATVTRDGLSRTLAQAGFEETGIRVGSQVGPGAFVGIDGRLHDTLKTAFRDVPVEVSAYARGDSYALTGQDKRTHPDLTTFALFTGIERHATLTEGRWAADGPAGGPVEATLSVPAAKAMKVKAGDTFTISNRLDHSSATVDIVGLFRVDRPDDPFWDHDPLATDGVEKGDYTTYGPLVVAPRTFGSRFAPHGVLARWLVQPEAAKISSDDLTGLADRLKVLTTDLTYHDSTVTTALPDLLGQLDTALLVTRSTMLVPVLQLIVLAGYALLLVARLMAEQRRGEVSLLRARGASIRQLSLLTFGEGLLLALPGAVIAPLAAPFLLELAAATPAINASGVRMGEPSSLLIWILTAGAAVACALALTVPTVSGSTATYVSAQTGRGRGERRGAFQRAGADLALLVVAGLGLWQLTRYGSPVTATTGGLGVDPLIVTGPALALLAGGALILRLVPVASGAAERLTVRGRGFASALGAWQVSRRPLRYAGPALLLVMAIAVGVLSLTASATWRTSQVAQADFQAGADVRVGAPQIPEAPSSAGQGAFLAKQPGVLAVSPVLRTHGDLSGQPVRVLAAGTADLQRVLTGAPETAALLGPLAAAVPYGAQIRGLITESLAARIRSKVGSGFNLEINGRQQGIVVTGIVRALPTEASDEPGVLVDLPVLTQQARQAAGRVEVPNEWWVSTRDSGPVVSATRSWRTPVVDRYALRRQLLDAPLGAALQGALTLGFIAALAFAVIGFVINATVSARERITEFAILRALGAGPRQIFGLLSVEQTFLVLLGLAGGTALGLGVSALVVPHLVLTIRATTPFPPVRLVVVWPPILLLLTSVLALLLLVLSVLVARLRSTGLGAMARIGEDS
jgi:hypothetical protein